MKEEQMGPAFFSDNFSTQSRVPRKRGGAERRQGLRHRNRTRQLVPRHIEDLQARLVERRNRPIKPIRLEPENVQPIEQIDLRGNGPAQIVVREIKGPQPMQVEDGNGERSGEKIAIEEEGFEIGGSKEPLRPWFSRTSLVILESEEHSTPGQLQWPEEREERLRKKRRLLLKSAEDLKARRAAASEGIGEVEGAAAARV
ncbi:uncharacterized protein A4U43_C08F18040 [Asparagus officinalis]|nr:uncharacterized protein A4U43_C08F18040 [Asparagus officinalis]